MSLQSIDRGSTCRPSTGTRWTEVSNTGTGAPVRPGKTSSLVNSTVPCGHSDPAYSPTHTPTRVTTTLPEVQAHSMSGKNRGLTEWSGATLFAREERVFVVLYKEYTVKSIRSGDEETPLYTRSDSWSPWFFHPGTLGGDPGRVTRSENLRQRDSEVLVRHYLCVEKVKCPPLWLRTSPPH